MPLNSSVRSQGESYVILDITCKTDKFNLSVVGEDFINDCCFGQDFSNWLVSKLRDAGIAADVLCMEDFGWANTANFSGLSYLICIGGTSDQLPDQPNFGTWHIMIEPRRTHMQRLRGKGTVSASDPVISKIVQIITAAGFSSVAVEP